MRKRCFIPAELSFIQYILVSLASFSGLGFGAYLASIAKEEIIPGERYLLWLKRALFVLIFAAFIMLSGTKNMLLALLFLAAAALFIRYADGHIFYAILGLLFALSAAELKFFIVISAGIFIFGLPTGTLFTHSLMKKRIPLRATLYRLASHHSLFFAVAIPLYWSRLIG